MLENKQGDDTTNANFMSQVNCIHSLWSQDGLLFTANGQSVQPSSKTLNLGLELAHYEIGPT